MLRYLFSILLVFFSISDAYSAKHYVVSPSGTATTPAACEWTNYPDAFVGTPGQPETIARHSGIVAGDTIYFRGGNYDYTSDDSISGPDYPIFNPANSGVSGNPITLRNYPDELPVLRNVDTGSSENPDFFCVIGSDSRSWIVIDGFKTTGSYILGTKIRLTGSSNIIVRNCVCEGIYGSGAGNYDGIRIQSCHDITISNNLIYNWNVAASAHGTGIKDYGSYNVTIEYNTLYNNDSNIYLKAGSHDFTIRYNFSYTTPNAANVSGCLIGASNDTSHTYADPYNIFIYQNVLRAGYYTDQYALRMNGALGNVTNIYLYNNTIYSDTGAYLGYNYTANPVNAEYNFNNAWYVDNVIMTYQYDYINYVDYNLYDSAGQQRFINGTGYTTVNTFIEWQATTGNPDAHGYREAITWDCEGLGNCRTSTNAADYKFTSTHKNSGRNADGYSAVIGAYITGSETIGYTPSGIPDTQCSDYTNSADCISNGCYWRSSTGTCGDTEVSQCIIW